MYEPLFLYLYACSLHPKCHTCFTSVLIENPIFESVVNVYIIKLAQILVFLPHSNDSIAI